MLRWTFMGRKGERICASSPGRLSAKGRTAEKWEDLCLATQEACPEALEARKVYGYGGKGEKICANSARAARFFALSCSFQTENWSKVRGFVQELWGARRCGAWGALTRWLYKKIWALGLSSLSGKVYGYGGDRWENMGKGEHLWDRLSWPVRRSAWSYRLSKLLNYLP